MTMGFVEFIMLFIVLVVVAIVMVIATPWIDRTIDRFFSKKPVPEGTMQFRPVVFVDVSGSMHQSFYIEALRKLNENNAIISLFDFHSRVNVDSERLWLRGDPFPESPRSFAGGGTDYQMIFEFLEQPENKDRWSSIHIVTDGYAPAPMTSTPINWIITKEGAADMCARPGDFVNKLS